jgi:tRNA A-37 threonylcarbamoyl transferase component Bud32
MENEEDQKISSAEELENVLKARKEKISNRKMNGAAMDRVHAVDHIMLANQWVKVINVVIQDKYIRDVLNQRIVSPLRTGFEKTHMAIAIELGMREDEVIACEEEGKAILFDHLEKCCSSDFIEKFNRNKTLQKTVEKTIKEIGN